MTSEDSEVIIRKARPEDLKDLLEIGDVYFGKDYFQAEYGTYFDNPVIYPLVAEMNGKAIGFYLNHVIDDGLTLIKRAARVHPSYRRSGVFHKLSEALDQHRKEFWPSIKYEVFGTSNRADRATKEFQDKGFVEVIRKRIFNMYVRIKDLRGIDTVENLSLVRKMSYDDVKTLFANKDVANKLIPKGILFNFFLGYRLLDANIKYVVNDKEFVLASLPTASSSLLEFDSSQVHKLRNFSDEAVSRIDIMSCAHKHLAEIGLCYEIDIYTADGFDKVMLKAHLIKHFQDFKESMKGDGITMISFNSNVCEEMLISILKEIGIVDFVPKMKTHKVFYERIV